MAVHSVEVLAKSNNSEIDKVGSYFPGVRSCGIWVWGGIKLAPLSLIGCDTVEIDVPPDVLASAVHFKTDLERYSGSDLAMRFVQAV